MPLRRFHPQHVKKRLKAIFCQGTTLLLFIFGGIMEKGRKIFIRFLIVLVSFLSVDGGSSFISAGNSVQILLSHHNGNDAEVPHKHKMSIHADDEKWINKVSFNFFVVNQTQHNVFSDQVIPSGNFSGSVWQPPKSL